MERRTQDREVREVMTVAQLAEFLGISLRAAYELVWAGTIPHARLGTKMIRIRRAGVERYLDERMAVNR
jgi:excisionase family DNA binding protein